MRRLSALRNACFPYEYSPVRYDCFLIRPHGRRRALSACGGDAFRPCLFHSLCKGGEVQHAGLLLQKRIHGFGDDLYAAGLSLSKFSGISGSCRERRSKNRQLPCCASKFTRMPSRLSAAVLAPGRRLHLLGHALQHGGAVALKSAPERGGALLCFRRLARPATISSARWPRRSYSASPS